MNVPTNCPYCGDPLLNNYVDMKDKTILSQICSLKLDHAIKVRSLANDKSPKIVELVSVRLEKPSTKGIPSKWAMWDFREQRLTVVSSIYTFFVEQENNSVVLPFFEPDLSNLPALIDKVKTYIVFT